MNFTCITPDYTVAAQISAADVAQIAALGYRSIMCNRPDGEEAAQPDFAVIDAAARPYGIVTIHVPVISGQIVSANIDAFRAAFSALPGPVFAYCRSGARCQNLWQLAGQ